MNQMMRRSLVVISLLIFIFSGSVHSQEGSVSLPSLPEGSLFLWNGTDKPVIFYLSLDEDNFTKYSLDADASEKLSFNKGTTVYYAIKSGEKLVKGELESQKRYRIILISDGEEYFDIVEIQG